MVGPGLNRNNNFGNRGGNNQTPRSQNQSQPQAAPLSAKKKLPDDYVDEAERVMRGLLRQDNSGNPFFEMTTSQIRKVLSLITEILNYESFSRSESLSDDSYQKLQMARVRIAYDAGREKKVKTFVDKSGLLSYIKGVEKNRADFMRFAQYVEALVAWHRYLGGKN